MANPRNVITRAGRWRVEVTGLKAVQTSFAELSAMLLADGQVNKYRRGLDIVKSGFARASFMLRDAARSALGNKSRRVTAATFAFADLDAGRTRAQKRSSLVGVRTGAPPRLDRSIYRVWGAGSTRKNGTTATNGLGISLGRIFESGTRYQRGTRFFSSAIRNGKSSAISTLVNAYKEAIRVFNG
jgi:hypothetical protein